MSVFPLVIDSCPAYLAGAADCARSVALVPYGRGTLLSHLSERLLAATRRRPIVVRTFEAGPEYEAAIRAQGAVNEPSPTAIEFSQRIGRYEPSDWLLIVDPRCFPVTGFDPSTLLKELGDTMRMALHLVALGSHAVGTQERVELDAEGRVRRVQRYYDAVTWTQTAGTVASLVPVSSLVMAPALSLESLAAFRRSLGATGAPARDVAIGGAVLDLTDERMVLRLNEQAAKDLTAADEGQAAKNRNGNVATGCRVATSARLLGAVILQENVEIGPQVTIVGPSVIGRDSVIHQGATIAQAVIATGSVVPADTVVRQRLFSAGSVAGSGGVIEPRDTPAGASIAEDLPHLEEEHQPRHIYPAIKAVVEGIIAAVALVMLSPVLAVIAALIKLESSGPIFYADPREAKDGKQFKCFKFRTMLVGADAAQRELMAANEVDGPQFKMDHDPRVTNIGRHLRAVSLDELPQLINVALGQMSLVGPRPSPFRENQTCVPWREARLSVRPGITGLWQVCRHERAHGDFHQWIYYDMQYVLHMSFWVDVKILIATVLTLGGKSHVPLSWIIPSGTTEGV
jgi:lipopolysaccharide/colanic/teichoic acid biosynthesis glycosyltransferase